ncbi:Fatty acid hydroxylase superfamily [Musa troglodytarum]|uniref:Fatty acid hydroxylase superfamily n=1 Tax=Musa troglodytarum TaxID=320322 RepID=A0A9E7JGH3_9LILI|nr:Fatty acid hydroxylase superfamily [Musa troglodytarum]
MAKQAAKDIYKYGQAKNGTLDEAAASVRRPFVTRRRVLGGAAEAPPRAFRDVAVLSRSVPVLIRSRAAELCWCGLPPWPSCRRGGGALSMGGWLLNANGMVGGSNNMAASCLLVPEHVYPKGQYTPSFWNLVKLIATPSAAPALFGGGLLGYVIYDCTHYYLHHGQPSKEPAKNLKVSINHPCKTGSFSEPSQSENCGKAMS